MKFLAGSGAIFLTFLAGAKLEPGVVKKKLRGVLLIGVGVFLSPFIGCLMVANYVFGMGCAGEFFVWWCRL